MLQPALLSAILLFVTLFEHFVALSYRNEVLEVEDQMDDSEEHCEQLEPEVVVPAEFICRDARVLVKVKRQT